MTNLYSPIPSPPTSPRKAQLAGTATAILISLTWALAAAWLFGNRSVLRFAMIYISMVVPLAGFFGWLIEYGMVKNKSHGCFWAILAPIMQTYIATYAIEIAEGPRDHEFYVIIHIIIFTIIYSVVFMAAFISSSRRHSGTS